MSSEDPPKLLRVREVAEMLSCRENHVWQMIYRRDIASVKLGRSRRVPMAAVQETIERGLVPSRFEAVT